MPRRVRTHVNPLSVTKEVSFDGFANQNPIWVDVGSCHGEFVFSLAERFPAVNFVGFEIRRPLFEKLRKRATEIPNLEFFDGDAGRNFENILRPSVNRGVKIERIFVNFPDPWFKNRHEKRRFLGADFLEKTASWINPEVRWIFQTDQKFLFDATLEIVRKSPFSTVNFFENPPEEARTDWESAKIREGAKIWRVEFGKSGSGNSRLANTDFAES